MGMATSSRRRFGLAAVLLGLAGVGSVLVYPRLPAEIATHWNAAGEPDATMPKAVGIAVVPVVAAGLLGLFAVIPRIDPLGENIAAFRRYYDWFVVVMTAFLVVVQAGIVLYNLGYVFDFVLVVLLGVAGVYYYVGVLLAHAERNWFVGVRTPWTLSSPEVWDQTHDLAGRLFKLTAGITLLGVVLPAFAVYFLVVPAVVTGAITVGYSYYLYTRLDTGDQPRGP